MILLIAYITILWILILLGGFILVEIVAKITLPNIYLESIVKAIIALAMSIAWIMIMIFLRDKLMKRVY